MSASTSSSTRPLTRGAACLPCRKLKAKCDGNKPACGRCLANNRPDDCEYATGAEVTRSRLLEENVALLEARIRELENPGESAPSVQLHDPRSQPGASVDLSRMLAASNMAAPGIQLYPASIAPPTGAIPDPTPQEIQLLSQAFMANASQLGFFLNPTRFRRAAAAHSANGALMDAIYLWGSRLSTSNTLRAREAAYADKATQSLTATTLTTQSATVLHLIQAEVLLAHYFFSTSRLLEGRYHCLAAVALVTGSRFHQLDVRAMAADPIAAGERVQAFWTVAALDKVWSAAMNTPPSISHNGRTALNVTTPWPLATEQYEQGMVVPRQGGNYTMDDFLRGAVDDSNEDFSPLAIRAKACALYDRAIYVASQYRIDMSNRNEFLARFGALDSLIERFHRQVAAIRTHSPEDMHELLISKTFACAAAIELHSTFSTHQTVSWQKTVSVAVAAGRALERLDMNQTRHLDPFIAILWSSIGKVLVGELRRIRQNTMSVRQEEVANVMSSLERITTVMAFLAPNSPIIGQHLGEIQQARASLN